MSFNKNMREIVHSKYGGHCAYCGCEITVKEMEIDHIIPEYHFEQCIANVDYGKDDLINLNPACRICNRYKDTFTVEKFRIQIQEITNRLLRYQKTFRIALKYGLIGINDFKIKFYFEKTEKLK